MFIVVYLALSGHFCLNEHNLVTSSKTYLAIRYLQYQTFDVNYQKQTQFKVHLFRDFAFEICIAYFQSGLYQCVRRIPIRFQQPLSKKENKTWQVYMCAFSCYVFRILCPGFTCNTSTELLSQNTWRARIRATGVVRL